MEQTSELERTSASQADSVWYPDWSWNVFAAFTGGENRHLSSGRTSELIMCDYLPVLPKLSAEIRPNGMGNVALRLPELKLGVGCCCGAFNCTTTIIFNSLLGTDSEDLSKASNQGAQ